MTITYRKNLGDGIRFNFATSVMISRNRRKWLIVALCFAALVIFLTSDEPVDNPIFNATIWGIIFATLYFIAMLIINTIILAFSKNFFQEKTVVLSNEGVKAIGEGITVDYDWKALYKISENDRLILIYTDHRCALTIPRDAFNSPDEAQTFFEYANQKFGDAHPKPSIELPDHF